MVNLETAITERADPVVGKNFHFLTRRVLYRPERPPTATSSTWPTTLDHGPVGMKDTIAAIAASKLPVVGIGHNAAEAFRPYREVIKDQRIAISGALDRLERALVTQWTATDAQPGLAFSIDPSRLVAVVAEVLPQVDRLVTFLHWASRRRTVARPSRRRWPGP